MKITVDKQEYASKAEALAEYEEAMACTDGSERERMTFAFLAISEGCTRIDTYKGIATK